MAEVVGLVEHKVTAEAGDTQNGSLRALHININQKKKKEKETTSVLYYCLLIHASKFCILKKKIVLLHKKFPTSGLEIPRVS